MIPAPNRPFVPAEGWFLPITPLDQDGTAKCSSLEGNVPSFLEPQTPRLNQAMNTLGEWYTRSRYHGGALQRIHDRIIPPAAWSSHPFASPEEEAHVKALLQPGDIIFTRYAPNPMQRLTVKSVKLLFGTEWLHGGVYTGNGTVIDSNNVNADGRPKEGGVAELPFDQFIRGKDKLLLVRPLFHTEEDRDLFLAALRKRKGKRYNYAMTLGIDRHYCMQAIYYAIWGMMTPLTVNLIPFFGRKLVLSTSFLSSPDFQVVYATKETGP